MVDISTEQLTALREVSISAIDGRITKTVQPVGEDSYLGTISELLLKLYNRFTTTSVTLTSGASVSGSPGVTVALGVGVFTGLYQGICFAISNTTAISGDPGSALGSGINTTGSEIRKIGVGLSLGDVSAVASSFITTGGTLTFIAGSVFATGESLASTGGESALYAAVPTPKFGPELIPAGILHIPNSFTTGDGLTNTMMTYSLREIAGFDLTRIIGTPTQP